MHDEMAAAAAAAASAAAALNANPPAHPLSTTALRLSVVARQRLHFPPPPAPAPARRDIAKPLPVLLRDPDRGERDGCSRITHRCTRQPGKASAATLRDLVLSHTHTHELRLRPGPRESGLGEVSRLTAAPTSRHRFLRTRHDAECHPQRSPLSLSLSVSSRRPPADVPDFLPAQRCASLVQVYGAWRDLSLSPLNSATGRGLSPRQLFRFPYTIRTRSPATRRASLPHRDARSFRVGSWWVGG
jgi:hypothetical protein